MRLKGRLVHVADVTPFQRDEMFALMDRHYKNVRRDTFAADLARKQWVIQVVHPDTGGLCGFSTQVILDVQVAGRPVKALFSGDTIVARDHWGDNALAHVWGRLALTLIERLAGAELYWFLISKGYKTYRFLPLFFHEFFPRRQEPTPAWARAVVDALGRHQYPDEYDPGSGLVRAAAGKDCLRRGVAEITPQRLRDPDVRYFLEKNPGHARGDELCCIAPLTRGNFTPAAWRVIGARPAHAGGHG
jgi:hypothetical protein